MSQRKKPGKVDETNGKRRPRRRPSGSEAEVDGTLSGSNSGGNPFGGMWTPRHLNDLKVSSIYNRNSAEAPAEVRDAAELYRKDLISAMKLPDSEPLTPEEYWLITDPWKQEWEKGVQVPVNPESLPEPEVVVISPVNERSHDFRLPKKKLIRVTHDDFFSPNYHQLVSTAARAEKVCSYDLDDIDASWLSCANSDRGMQNLPVVSEFLMEQVIEELELQCWEQVQTILKSQEGLGIEYDENVICDVCRSPESEEGNEMVFCDACNICVHQACYGITTIPSGSWLCRTCTLGIRPACVLCPNMGGAMKATRSGQKWSHVACAIWIPEVSIGSVEKMEPITKISSIPQSRWSLICVLCKDKTGACIQCSVKTCKTAYHVTCAFKNGLEMKPIIVDENAEDGIKLRSYCQKHSVNTKKDKSTHSGSEEDLEKKKMRAMTAEERNQARAEKLQLIESEFYKYVRLKDVAQNLAVDMDIVMLVYNYWKLKRKSLNNRPLVPPRPETTQLLTQQQEQDLEQMKMFVQLRQDLERVRNLCYMVSRREKLSRAYFRLREQTFQKQAALLGDKTADVLKPEEKSAILEANHGTSIYDQIYSCDKTQIALKDYDTLVSLIAGDDNKKQQKLVNGLIKPKKSSTTTTTATETTTAVANTSAFKKQFVNGARKKNLIAGCSSLSESEASANETATTRARKVKLSHIAGRKPLSYLFDSDSSADEKAIAGGKNKKKSPGRKLSGKKSSTSDSDELQLPVPKHAGTTKSGKAEAPIYSDSDSEDASSKKRTASPMATKAAMKEFTKKGNANKKEPVKKAIKPQAAAIRNKVNNNNNNNINKGVKGPGRRKKGLKPTALIVPQREAAKKATESIRSVKQKKDANGNAETSSIHEGSVASPASVARLTERESESFEKTAFEKFKDIAAASVQDKLRGTKRNEKTKAGRVGGVGKKANNNNLVNKDEPIDAQTLSASELQDQYEFDDDGSKGVPNFVPQRQAAKKAAEHIRSGLSNIVAARLIIEDEMEAARKKTKGGAPTGGSIGGKRMPDGSPAAAPPTNAVKNKPHRTRGKSPGEGDDSITNAESKPRARKRILSKDIKGPAKGSRKETAEVSATDRQTDWPFLDMGMQSQSACRRSRERSSSSSSSSSSGSSSSDSSSSSRSSASSSPASASPDQTKATSKQPSSLPTITPSSRVPGRKLKTSDRSPDGGLSRSEIITGKKPPPKGRGPRPGGTSAGSTSYKKTPAAAAFTRSRPSAASKPSDNESRSPRKQKISVSSSNSSSSSSDSSSDDNGRSPSPSRNLTKKNSKLAQEKGKRGKREPSGNREKTKGSPSKVETANNKPGPKSQTRTPTKALTISKIATPTPTHGGLHLSSDSDNEEGSPKKSSCSSPDKHNSHSSVPTPDARNLRAAARAKKKPHSDSENELEKENSCKKSEAPPSATPSSSNLRNNNIRTVPKSGNTPSSNAISILSPLTPSSENKDKEHSSRCSDAEPDAKRSRLDTGSSETTTPTTTQVPTGPSSGANLFSSSNSSAPVGGLSAKSLFSPRAGHENDLVDFDSELYDLARSVSADYSQVDEEGGAAASSLQFFSQSFLSREDAVEDSPHATLNLVEKLRLQHARKSGCPRSSMDGSDLSEDPIKSPTRLSHEQLLGDPSKQQPSSIDTTNAGGSRLPVNENNKRSSLSSTVSPEREKINQGDERWVPPSVGKAEQSLSSELDRDVGNYRKNVVGERQKRGSSENQVEINSIRLKIPEQHPDGSTATTKIGSESCLKPLSVSLVSPTMSPLTSPKMKASMQQQHGVMFPPVSSSATGGGFPPRFMYPGAPSMPNPMTVPVGPNSPRSTFFRGPPAAQQQQQQASSLSPDFPRQSFTGAQQQHLLQVKPHSTKDNNNLTSPTISPSNQRRTSTPFMDESTITDSIASVTSLLAKPSIASPSMILAATNVKNITPAPPPQSTVAQIIENVVNNHANNNMGAGLAAQELLSVMLGLQSQNAQLAEQLDPTRQKLHPPTTTAATSMSSSTSIFSDPYKLPSNLLETAAAFGVGDSSTADKVKKIVESTTLGEIREESDQVIPKAEFIPSGKSPGRGRGRRAAATPRAPPKSEKILTTCETNGVKRGRGERKSGANTSPQNPRAKAATAGGRGRGRGKGRGKSLVATRKDLAGTVYDIDFDEFEENVDEKLDLRSLRERRKSSDIHGDKTCKTETSPLDSSHRLTSIVISSPKTKDLVDNIRNIPNQKSALHSQQSLVTTENVMQQAQPSVPVDMRTYSGGVGNSIEFSHDDDGKQPKSEGLLTRFGDASTVLPRSEKTGSLMNDIEELEETFDDKSSSHSMPAKNTISGLTSVGSFSSAAMRYQRASVENQSNLASKESTIDNFLGVDPDFKATTDFSRNQLKVKIKGPFLDANYGSHSMGESAGVPHYPNSLHHHPAGPSQIVNIPASNTSNLRRMRKKELLRQYWNQDMNMDGSSYGPNHDSEISHSSMIHRSVITIPKAVASMAIIPTKDDYRESFPMDDPMSFSGSGSGLLPSAAKVSAAEKRKRNRGIREMTALGIITCDTPRERRRDRNDPNSSSNFSNEAMGKKRGKANKRPIRSMTDTMLGANIPKPRTIFIPPTLVDSDHSTTGDKKVINSKITNSSSIGNATNAVVTAVNHPTPKLKIKFGDMSKGPTSSTIASSISNHVLSDSSDKETPNKKAKGRPPKKRGLSELPSSAAAPPTMEDLKRESMKFREMVMQDFAGQERKEILQLQGTRRHKKNKRKGGGAGNSETEDGVNKITPPEVKVIADGSTKLILRFGKGRTSVGGGDGEPKKEGEASSEKEMDENDSGFTGSSEGSSGSIADVAGSSITNTGKDKSSNETTIPPEVKPGPLLFSSISTPTPTASTAPPPPNNGTTLSDTSSTLPPVVNPLPPFPNNLPNNLPTPDVKPQILENCNFQQQQQVNSADKIMPIRLKLSRCFEGYSLNKKQESCSGDGVPPPAAKQSDSCEVR